MTCRHGIWGVEQDGSFYPVIAGGKGGGSTTTVNTVAPATPLQNQLQQEQLQEIKRQESQFAQASAYQDPNGALAYLNSDPSKRDPNSVFHGVEAYDTPTFRNQLTQQASTTASQQQLQTTVLNQLNQRLSGNAPLLTDAQQKGLDQTYASAQSQGEQNLTRYLGESANMRGLNISDSPVITEGARQAANLNLGLQSAKASSALDLSQAGNNFNAAIADFTANLNQQAYANRVALAGYQSPTLSGLSNNLQALQMAQGTSKSSYNVPGFGQVAAGVGSLLGGLGGAASGLAAFSDRRLKSHILRVGTHPLGVGIYDYDIAGHRERGVMADEVKQVKPSAVVAHQSGYDMVDYARL